MGVLLIVVAASIAACGSSAPVDHALDDDAITIASFDFPESETLAEIYAGALRAQGFEVRHVRRVGTREMVLPALERGLVEVVPEYAGSALEFLGGRPSVDPDSSLATLRVSLDPRGIDSARAGSRAEQNGLVVTTRTATEHRRCAA